MSTTRIKQVIKDSDACADRSYTLAVQTKQIGFDTNEELKSQGQQLKRTEEQADIILYKQKEAERHLSAIESFSGVLLNKLPFRRNKIKHAKDDPKKINTKKRQKTAAKTAPVPVKVKCSSDGCEPIDYDLLDSDAKITLQHTNTTVEKISDIVDDLKKIAIEQGDEIDAHNTRLPRLQKKITKAQETMDVQTSRVRRGY